MLLQNPLKALFLPSQLEKMYGVCNEQSGGIYGLHAVLGICSGYDDRRCGIIYSVPETVVVGAG